MREIKPTMKRWRIKSEELPLHRQQQNCLSQSLPEDLGKGQSDSFLLDQDLSYIETHYTPSKNLAVLTRMDHCEPRMVVTLGLKGQSRFSGQRDEVVFKEGYTAITTFNSSLGERQYEANKPVTQLRFSISQRWLDNYFGENRFAPFFTKNSMRVVASRPISTHGIIAAHQLLTCNVVDEARAVFMKGQAMSILAAELAHLCGNPCEDTSRFNQRDRVIANTARDILFHEFKTPPSVEALARRAGTNQFKLKQLFHYFFNNTPYGLLLEIRMTHAYRLLESTHCPVSVAADHVGYNHASNFSAAFTKYFGIPPKAVARKSC
jgi:AraC family transcriptional activator of pyochelin receptor